jgi:hypothetical protein
MNALVLVALRRPYTFVVLAILILLFDADRHLSADQDTRRRLDLDLHRPDADRHVGPDRLLL